MKGTRHPLRCPKPHNHKSRVHYPGSRPPSNTGDSGVAFFAHVGGFIFGAVVARILLSTGRITAQGGVMGRT